MSKINLMIPMVGICGSNILYEELKVLNSENEYSMKAITPHGFLLTVKLKGEEESNWSFSVSKRNGWFVETFDASKREQIFKMDEDSKADIVLNFSQKGKAVIEFYKNSENLPFAIKEIVWS